MNTSSIKLVSAMLLLVGALICIHQYFSPSGSYAEKISVPLQANQTVDFQIPKNGYYILGIEITDRNGSTVRSQHCTRDRPETIALDMRTNGASTLIYPCIDNTQLNHWHAGETIRLTVGEPDTQQENGQLYYLQLTLESTDSRK